MLTGEIENVFGWPLKVVPDRFGKVNPRTLQNLPVQSAGASILQLACIRLVEADIRLCAPIHDAVLIEGSTEEIVACNEVGEPILDAKGNYTPGPVAKAAQEIMAEAAKDVIGSRIETDLKAIVHPERFMDPRGERMWEKVMKCLERSEHLHQQALQPEIELRIASC
jgi:hypothetical protein